MVLGASQTGKRMYVRERLRRPHDGVTLIWSWLETTDRYTEFLGGHQVLTIPALTAALKAGERRLVYVPGKISPVPKLSDKEYVDKQFAYFCRIVAAVPRPRCVVEELSHVTTPSWAPPAWSTLSTAGAHDHLELIGVAQQPTMIDKRLVGNCTELRCFRMFYEGDARTLAGNLRIPYSELMDLPKFHYRHRVIETRETTAGVQAVVT